MARVIVILALMLLISALIFGLTRKPGIDAVAKRHSASIYQVALAWTLAQPGVIAIPKATDPAHLRENIAAIDIRLTKEDLAELDKAFPPPKGKVSLGML